MNAALATPDHPHAAKATAIVLAGLRAGRIGSLAAEAGLADKCLVPVAGRPMIDHVLAALADTPGIARVVVSSGNRAVLAGLDQVRRLRSQQRIALVAAKLNLVDSLSGAARGAAFPLLVTTADNVLLTPAAVRAILADAEAAGADVTVAFARREAVMAAHPDGQRRFYRFADDGYSNCNAYWIRTPRAMAAADAFRGGGQFAKHPWRIVRAFGIVNLIRFRYGIGTLDGAFARLSRRFGLAIRPVILADGAIAIDVDNRRTLDAAETILAARAAARDGADGRRIAASP